MIEVVRELERGVKKINKKKIKIKPMQSVPVLKSLYSPLES